MSDLILKDVSFSYPGGFLAVDHINMEIKSGENVAIVGQNGAGKTTTVKMMNGLLKPTEGDVLIGDMNTKDYTTAQVSRVVGTYSKIQMISFSMQRLKVRFVMDQKL